MEMEITSPDYPDFYPVNVTEYWYLHSETGRISIEVVEFQVCSFSLYV